MLLVDDDEGILEVTGEVLVRAGFRVLTARGGREALDRVRAAGVGGIDAVVLDLAMPDMSGEEVFLRLRELRSDLPVILVTGYDAASHRRPLRRPRPRRLPPQALGTRRPGRHPPQALHGRLTDSETFLDVPLRRPG